MQGDLARQVIDEQLLTGRNVAAGPNDQARFDLAVWRAAMVDEIRTTRTGWAAVLDQANQPLWFHDQIDGLGGLPAAIIDLALSLIHISARAGASLGSFADFGKRRSVSPRRWKLFKRCRSVSPRRFAGCWEPPQGSRAH